MNVIQAGHDLKQYVGHPKRVIKAGKFALQIEVRNKAQAENLRKVKKLAGFNVVIEPHRTLNKVKGVVKSKSFGKCTEKQVMQSLEDQGVASIRRMKVKRDGQLVNTDTYVILCNRNDRPKVIKLSDWHGEIVEEYREKPQPCYNCQRFNHIAKYCQREVSICMQCGQETGVSYRSDIALRIKITQRDFTFYRSHEVIFLRLILTVLHCCSPRLLTSVFELGIN